MTNQIDLNRLRETLTRNQSSTENAPNVPQNDKVYVTPEGKLVMGDQVNENQRTVSEIPQTVFARQKP
jgi:hypothetical protein